MFRWLIASILFTTPALAGERLLVKGSLDRVDVPLRVEKKTLFGWAVVDAPDGAAARIAAAPGVKAVEPARRLKALRTPNDPGFRALWGFRAVEAEAAWDITTGSAGQRVGVVDTGIRRDHVDLAAKDAAGFDFVSDPGDAGDGDGRDADYSDEGGDDEFHGSHVAGTIAARGNDRHGVPGLNWRAKLVTARALGTSGGGDIVDIMEAAAWLAGFSVDGVPDVGDDRVSVINMSLGAAGPCSAFERDVTGQILDAGVVLVAAAGNDGGATGSPASCPGVIAVGAVDADSDARVVLELRRAHRRPRPRRRHGAGRGKRRPLRRRRHHRRHQVPRGDLDGGAARRRSGVPDAGGEPGAVAG